MSEQVPVLLVIFNRPEKTRIVIDALRKVRPARLFVAADGPRLDYPEDEEKCRLARQAATDIDWPCDLQTRFHDINIGCEPSVSSAIGWFFDQIEYGIILEDDCVPHPHFLSFCGELFERYANDERIMQISGTAPYSERTYPYDYHFSRTFRCFGGWGTWRRAWKYFSFNLDHYDKLESFEILKSYAADRASLRLLYMRFLDLKKGAINNWDYLWHLACYAQNGLCIVPENNLIMNIGFDAEATHTRYKEPVFDNIGIRALEFPLSHPLLIYADSRPERSFEKNLHRTLRLRGRFKRNILHAAGAITEFFETKP